MNVHKGKSIESTILILFPLNSFYEHVADASIGIIEDMSIRYLGKYASVVRCQVPPGGIPFNSVHCIVLSLVQNSDAFFLGVYELQCPCISSLLRAEMFL